jgi:hypothetical protein
MEFIIDILGEFILQVVLEVLVEIGLHSIREPFKRPQNAWLASVGYTIFGCAAGAISLWISPTNFIPEGTLRKLNLVATPVAVGVVMAFAGAYRTKRGQRLVRLNRFSYGFLFALSIALVRFEYAH